MNRIPSPMPETSFQMADVILYSAQAKADLAAGKIKSIITEDQTSLPLEHRIRLATVLEAAVKAVRASVKETDFARN